MTQQELEEASAHVPADVVMAASEAITEENDRAMVVGYHSYFGWVYCDNEDYGHTAELTDAWVVHSCGIVGTLGNGEGEAFWND